MADETVVKILDIQVRYKEAIERIAQYRKSIEDAKEEQKRLKKELDDGKISADEYGKQLESSKMYIKQQNDAINTLTRQVNNQIKAENEMKGSLTQLRAQLSNATAEYDRMSKAERESARGTELRDHINELTDELKEAEEETQRYYRNVGNYEESIKSALGINNGFANSILQISQGGGGFQGVLSNMGASVKAFGTTLLSMLTNPVFLAIAGIAGVGMAFKWFYDYNKGLQEASKLTTQFTGLHGDEMKEYRNTVQAVADTYDKDFKETLTAANALSKQFGIDQQEAMELIKDGFVSGADAGGNFLDIVREYPAYFKEAGLSAKEFMAVTTSANTSGVVGSKAIETIKEANTRIREMSQATADTLDSIGLSSKKIQDDLKSGATTTFEVMKQVSEKLNGLPESSQVVGSAIANIFGGPGQDAGLQYLKTLKDIETNMDNVKEAAGEMASLEERQLESQINLQNAMSGLFDFTGGTFEELVGSCKIFINDGLAAIINGISGVIDWFKEFYNESAVFRAIVVGFSMPFKVTFETIKLLLNSLINSFKLAGQVIKAVFTLDFKGVGTAWNNFTKSMKEDLSSFVENQAANYKDAFTEVVSGSVEVRAETKTTTTPTASPTTTTPTGKKTLSADELKQIEEQKKAEREAIRKAEDELLKLIVNERERQRKQVELQYNRQIEDLRTKLATEKNLTTSAREAINNQITALEKQKDVSLQKLSQEALKEELETAEKLLALKLDAVREGTEEELALRKQQLEQQLQLDLMAAEQEYTNEEQKQQALAAIRERYRQEELSLDSQHKQNLYNKQKEAIAMEFAELELAQTEESARREGGYIRTEEEQAAHLQRALDQIGGHEAEKLQLQYENAEASLAALLERGMLENQTQAEYDAELLAAKQASATAQANINSALVANEQAKANAMKGVTQGLCAVLDQLGESNTAFAKMSKVITLAQIAIDTGRALSQGIASASAVPFPGNIVAIATTVATVLANVATAISTVKAAKFATGGKVNGPGTGTSDSIPAMLSNGEFVMTAKATRLFEPLLVAMNGIGSGVPMQVQNSYEDTDTADMMADSFENAARKIKPVVSVVEIIEAQERVDMIENLDNF